MKYRLLALVLLAGCGDSGGGGDSAVASGADPFDDAVLATYDLTMPETEWALLTGDLEDNTWRPCRLAWRGETYDDVAVHPAGQSSRESAHRRKPSLWLKFNEFVPGREFHGYERVKLDAMGDDPAVARERLAYPVYAARGVPAPRIMHCRVTINGRYLGLYVVEERVNKEFVTKRFGKGTVNQLYKWTEAQPDFRYDPGWAPSAYAAPEDTGFPMWESRIETVPVDAEGVQNLLRVINTDPANAGAVFDVDGFLNFMAAEVATGETDGYIGNNHTNPNEFYTGNLYLYKSPASGRYLLAVWDRDQSFWRPEPQKGLYDQSVTFGFDRRIVTRQIILNQPAHLALYKQYLREVVDSLTLPSTLNARLDTIIEQIREAAYADPNRLLSPTPSQLEAEWADLRRRFDLRRETIVAQLGP